MYLSSLFFCLLSTCVFALAFSFLYHHPALSHLALSRSFLHGCPCICSSLPTFISVFSHSWITALFSTLFPLSANPPPPTPPPPPLLSNTEANYFTFLWMINIGILVPSLLEKNFCSISNLLASNPDTSIWRNTWGNRDSEINQLASHHFQSCQDLQLFSFHSRRTENIQLTHIQMPERKKNCH